MTAWAAVVAYSPELVGRRKQVQHTALERNSEEVAVPIVVHTEAAEAVHMVVVHTEIEVAVPIVVHMEAAEVVPAVRMVVEVAVPNLVVAVGLDHKTWIIPSCLIFIISHCYIRGNRQYHTTGVKANRQVSIREVNHQNILEVHNAKNVLYVIVFVEYFWSSHLNECTDNTMV